MTAQVPEEPRNGSYLPTVTWVDQEGGGDVRVNAAMCRTCKALVDEPSMGDHTGWHESLAAGAGPGDETDPKMR